MLEKGYYREMMDVIRGVMQAMKDNTSLKFAVITGCLRIAKESIFTGTNNFVSDTSSDTRLNKYFGFTQPEMDQLLRERFPLRIPNAEVMDIFRKSVKTWFCDKQVESDRHAFFQALWASRFFRRSVW